MSPRRRVSFLHVLDGRSVPLTTARRVDATGVQSIGECPEYLGSRALRFAMSTKFARCWSWFAVTIATAG